MKDAKFNERAYNAVFNTHGSTDWMMFDGRAAYAAALKGEIPGWGILSKPIENPRAHYIWDLMPLNFDFSRTARAQKEEFDYEPLRRFYKPEKEEYAATWAYIASNDQ